MPLTLSLDLSLLPVHSPCRRRLPRDSIRGTAKPTGSRISAMTQEGYAEALEAISTSSRLPEVVVLDLDYCSWPFWCEMYTPDDTPRLYPETRGIIDAVRDSNMKFAVASRTPTPHVARSFLKKLDLMDKIDNMQLIPASSGFDQTSAQKDKAHFPKIRQELGIDYGSMLFFDDEHKNILRVSKLGVCSILVDTSTGVDVAIFRQGLEKFAAGNA
ncbi:hypothetical protein BSKO_07437 [Bryopsis sp. KO-2023]|nr:hypothetical protein BSKO_07437 [Bryopsis sp. KO-2023]